MYDVVSHTVIHANKITGNGSYAVQIGAFATSTPGVAVSNRIVDNDISGFQSSIADLFLDVISQQTVAIGDGGTALDLGTDNILIGFTKL